jgi:SAM-dependent methyltransferase
MVRWTPHVAPCPICDSSLHSFIGRRGGVAHRLGLGVVTNVVRCNGCGCYYTRPTLLPESNPYAGEGPDTYFRTHDSERKVAAGQELARVAGSLLGRRGSMLELGCGRGELLEGARREGWEVFGVEMTPAYAAVAESLGVPVERATIDQARSLGRQYDAILLAAVLEHLYEPLTALRRVRKALARGGLIFVDVPNEASLAMVLGNLYMRMRGRDWAVNLSPTFPPFHVVGFTPMSLRRALTLTGFRVVRLTQFRWPNALPSTPRLARRIERAGLTIASWVGRSTAMSDGISCWASAV